MKNIYRNGADCQVLRVFIAKRFGYCYISFARFWQTKRQQQHDCKSKLNRHNSFNDRLTCILLSCASQKHSSTLCGSNISTRQHHSKCTCFLRDNDDNQNASTVLCLHNSNSNRNSICYSDKSQGT